MDSLVKPKEFVKNTTKSLIDKIRSLLPQHDLHLLKHAPKLIIYLLNTRKKMSVLLKNSFFSVPIPSRFFDNHFEGLVRTGGNGLKKLKALGLIKMSNYSRADNLCREYAVSDELLLELMLFAEREKMLAVAEKLPVLKNPVTIPAPTVVHTHAVSDLLSDAISYKYADVVYLKKLQEYCVERYTKIKNKCKINPKRYASTLRSIATDYYKFVSMNGRSVTNADTNISSYTRNFTVTKTGRICERSGLQTISRGAKRFLYKDIERINNYDFKSSQICLLSYYAKQLNIDTSWIDSYVANANSKFEYARRVGISVDGWKKTVLSVIFGSSASVYGTPYQTILNEKNGDRTKADECYNVWLKETEPLVQTCKKWLTSVKHYAKINAIKNVVTNAVGVSVNLTNATAKFLSAFYLQGLESRILCELISYPTNEYTVISPEFDGIVVQGTVSNQIWSDVLKRSNVENINLQLENKPFGG